MVLVDTTIWSLALRRRKVDLVVRERSLVEEWTSLVASGRAALIGPIRQEILSGIRHDTVFRAIGARLSPFPLLEILPPDYDRAAAFFNACRRHGVTGSAVDMLVCAVASRVGAPVFTTDPDFARYVRHVPLRLHVPDLRTA